ncbi:hypothetical protein NYA30BAC_01315 [Halomonas sp. NYA30]
MTPKTPSRIRKHPRKDPMEDTRKLQGYARNASHTAIKQQLERGVPVVYVKNGNIVKVSADKTEKVIKAVAPKKPFDLRAYLCQDLD